MVIRKRLRAVDNTLEFLRELEMKLGRYVEALEKRVVFNEAELERIPAQLEVHLNRAKERIDFKMTQLIMKITRLKDTLAALEKSEKSNENG